MHKRIHTYYNLQLIVRGLLWLVRKGLFNVLRSVVSYFFVHALHWDFISTNIVIYLSSFHSISFILTYSYFLKSILIYLFLF